MCVTWADPMWTVSSTGLVRGQVQQGPMSLDDECFLGVSRPLVCPSTSAARRSPSARARAARNCWLAASRLLVDIVRKRDGQRGFEVLPRRWVVERTFSWITSCRRLACDYGGRQRYGPGWPATRMHQEVG